MSIEKDFSEEAYQRAKRSPLYKAYLEEKYLGKYSEISQDFFGREPFQIKKNTPEWGSVEFEGLPIKDKMLGYYKKLLEDSKFNLKDDYEKIIEYENYSENLLNDLAKVELPIVNGKIFVAESESYDILDLYFNSGLLDDVLKRNYKNLSTAAWHIIFSRVEPDVMSRKDILFYENSSPTYQKFREEIFEKYKLNNSSDMLFLNLDLSLKNVYNQNSLNNTKYLLVGPKNISDIKPFIKEWGLDANTATDVYSKLCLSLDRAPLELIVNIIEKNINSVQTIQSVDELLATIFDKIAQNDLTKQPEMVQQAFLKDFVVFCNFLERNERKLSDSLSQENFIQEIMNENLVNLFEQNIEEFLLKSGSLDVLTFSSKFEILDVVFKHTQPSHKNLSFIKEVLEGNVPLDDLAFKKIMDFPGLARFAEVKRREEFEFFYGKYLDREKEQESINWEVLGVNLSDISNENLAKLISYCANHEDDLLDMTIDDVGVLVREYESEGNLSLIFTPEVFKAYTKVLRDELLNGIDICDLKQIDASYVQIKGELWSDLANDSVPFLQGQKNLIHERLLSSDNDCAVVFAKRMGLRNKKTENAIIKNGALKLKKESLFKETLTLSATVNEKENRLDFSIHTPAFLEKQIAEMLNLPNSHQSLFNAYRLGITDKSLPGEEYREIKDMLGVNYSGFQNPLITSLWGSQRSSDPTWEELNRNRKSLGELVYSVAYFIKLTHIAHLISENDINNLDKEVIKNGLINFLTLQESETILGVKSFAGDNNRLGSFTVSKILGSLLEKEETLISDANLYEFTDIIDGFNKKNPIVANQSVIFNINDSPIDNVIKTVMSFNEADNVEKRKMFLSKVLSECPENLEKIKKYIPKENVFFIDYVNALSFKWELSQNINKMKENKISISQEKSFKL